MTYPNIHIHDVETGQVINREMTPQEYEAFWLSLEPTIEITSENPSILQGETCTVIFQMMSAPRYDGTRVELTRAVPITYAVQGVQYEDETDASGLLSVDFLGAYVGTFSIVVVNLNSNTLIIEVA